MKTALTELIEWSEKDLEIFIEDTDEALRIYEAIKDKATELLEKEREQIEKAYTKGGDDEYERFDKEKVPPKSAEEYYNEKYNQ